MWLLSLFACAPDHGGPLGKWKIVEASSHQGPRLPDELGGEVVHPPDSVEVDTAMGTFLASEVPAVLAFTTFRFILNEGGLSTVECDEPRPGLVHSTEKCGWVNGDPHVTTWDREAGQGDEWGGLWFHPDTSTCTFGHKHAMFSMDDEETLRIEWIQVMSRYRYPVDSEEACWAEELSKDHDGPWELFLADSWIAVPVSD